MGIPHVPREELPSFPRLSYPLQDHLSLRLTFVERPALGVRGCFRMPGSRECVWLERNTHLSYRRRLSLQNAPERKNMDVTLSQAHCSEIGRHPSHPSGHSTFHSQTLLPRDPLWFQILQCSWSQSFPHPNPEDLLLWRERYWFRNSWWLPATPLISI